MIESDGRGPRPRVFVPQVPTRRDPDTGVRAPTVSLAAAEAWGEVRLLLPPEASLMAPLEAIATLRERMADYAPTDYLVPIGDPTLFAAAVAFVARLGHGAVLLLKWDRRLALYNCVRVPA